MVKYAREHRVPDPESTAQQAWAQAWERLWQYDGRRGAAFRTWVYRIMDNVIRDQIRRQAVRKLDFVADPPERSLWPPDYTAAIDVERLLASLDCEERKMLELFHLQGLSFREIAGLVDRPQNTVKTLAFRGRKHAAEIAGAKPVVQNSSQMIAAQFSAHAESAA